MVSYHLEGIIDTVLALMFNGYHIDLLLIFDLHFIGFDDFSSQKNLSDVA